MAGDAVAAGWTMSVADDGEFTVTFAGGVVYAGDAGGSGGDAGDVCRLVW